MTPHDCVCMCVCDCVIVSGGRVCRPLIVVKRSRPLLTAKHMASLGKGLTLEGLLRAGVIEYVDVNEENNCLISLNEGAADC